MNLLLSLLDGENQQVVSAMRSNGIFYGLYFKALKREYRNPYVVAHLKLTVILDLPQISIGDSKGLLKFHPQLQDTITWLCSIGYIFSLKTTENVSEQK